MGNSLIHIPVLTDAQGGSQTHAIFPIARSVVARVNSIFISENGKQYNGDRLVSEHADYAKQGSSPLEIMTWLAEKLDVIWSCPNHHGTYKTCSLPQGNGDILRFFASRLGVSPSLQGPSDTHPHLFLASGSFWNALLGPRNMQRIDVINHAIHQEWCTMGSHLKVKERFLKSQIGLNFSGDWNKLTGVRIETNAFAYPNVLHSTGSLASDQHNILSLFLEKRTSDTVFIDQSIACLCFLG